MTRYRATVSIEVDAENVDDAARLAYRLLWADLPATLTISAPGGVTSTLVLPQSELSHLRSEAVEDKIQRLEEGNAREQQR